MAELRARATTLDDAQFLLGVAAAVALSGNAHTSVDAEAWRATLASSPVRFAWFPEGLYVVRAMTGHEDLLGARVGAIDGLDPVTLLGEAARYVPGTPERVRAVSPALLESPAVLHALHPQAPADALVLDVEDAVHGARRVSLPAVAPRGRAACCQARLDARARGAARRGARRMARAPRRAHGACQPARPGSQRVFRHARGRPHAVPASLADP